MQTFHVIVYGCQMNDYDGEAMNTALLGLGMRQAETPEDADLVIVTTCAVRASAADRAIGRLNALGSIKQSNPDMKLAVGGCLAQAEAEKFFELVPKLDMVFGTAQVPYLSGLVQKLAEEGGPIVAVEERPGEPTVELSGRRSPLRANVSIMRGCDNFCAYCIVPYVRGREVYRETDEVLSEVNELVSAGYKDITLIGQNVNSYKRGDFGFARLLREANTGCDGVFLRFTTNHPRDFDDEVVAAVGDCENVARNVHLPLQAGSDRVLERMNRGYTSEGFIALAEKLRAAKPGLCLTSDIMVGFPGETENDFEATLDVVRRVRFDGAYTFIYSPRPGTEAAKWEDDVPREEKKRRINKLIALQRDISREQNARFLGRTVEVLVEGPSKKDPDELAGHNSENKVVNFAGSADIGQIVRVKVTEASSWTLRGDMVVKS